MAIIGDATNNLLVGTIVNDEIIGLGGNDTLLGGLGLDILDGGTGNDTLDGGDGNDIFIGSSGNDTLNGGASGTSDTADYSTLGQSITLLPTGTLNKGGGFGTDKLIKIDTIIANATVANNTIDAFTSGAGVSINVNLQTQILAINGVPGVGPFTVVNFDNVRGTNANDTITGDSQNNQLFGNGGNDILDGGFGNDTLDGGFGNNTLNGGFGNDSLIGSQGSDILDGGLGIDTANYSSLAESITLKPTGTVNKAGGGTDQLSKIERIIANAAVANNTIDASTAGGGASINVNLQTQTLTVNGVPGVGPFTVVNFDNVRGTNANDIITGDSQNNQLFANGGNDTLSASLGSDTLDGGAGTDTADYSSLAQRITLLPTGTVNKSGGGTDQLSKIERIIANAAVANNTIDASTAGGGASINANLQTQTLTVNGVPGVGPFTVVNFDDVRGTNANDTITGDSQNNQLFGNGGNDILDGGLGNDTLNGGLGNDTLNGGLGNDILIASQGSDILNGGADTDTADYSSLAQSITLLPTGIVNKAGGGTDQLSKIERIIANAAVANNTIDTSTAGGGASINANLQTQTLTVNGVPGVGPFTVVNFDNVRGTNANDIITGDSQNNQLFGNGGNDTIDGGFGLDVMDGGAGIDTLDVTFFSGAYVLNLTTGVTNFVGETAVNFENVNTGSGNDIITGSAANNVINTGGGNDILIGGFGNDTLTGGLGADKFVFNSLIEGIDKITDFSFFEDDKIQISQSGFGSSSFSDFNYNSFNGNLSFQGVTFANIQNSLFLPSLDIEFIA